jgi:hypothetical protein
MIIKKIKNFLKKIPLLNNILSYIYKITVYKFTREVSLDVLAFFPLYKANNGGKYFVKTNLAINCIKKIIPLLNILGENLYNKVPNIIKIQDYKKRSQDPEFLNQFKKVFDKYGSDKSRHGYHFFYTSILKDKEEIKNIFEIGLGTNNLNIPSNMGIKGRPGASLKAFKEIFKNSNIYGADIDKKILFEEERIKTFYLDQTDTRTFDDIIRLIPKNFDLAIDDGLHAPDANIASLIFFLKIIKVGGWAVIEDIGAKSIEIWKTVSYLLPKEYMSQILQTYNGSYLFAVKKLKATSRIEL